jgi:hypothetical protein
MARLTYKELADKISKMTEEQKQKQVTVLLSFEGEFFEADDLHFTGKQDDLGEGHPFFLVKNG